MRHLAIPLCLALAVSGAVAAAPGSASADPVDELGDRASFADPPGIPPGPVSPVRLAPMERVAATGIAPGLAHNQYDNGVVEADVLVADLTEESLRPQYLYPGKTSSFAVISRQAFTTGAIAAVNGDFFRATGPRGIGIRNGDLLNGPAQGWNDTAAFSTGDTGSIGRVKTIRLDAHAGSHTPGFLNHPQMPLNALGIYNADFGAAARSAPVSGAARVREVEVTDGKVSAVRTSTGAGQLAAGTKVLLGREAGADALATYQVGDEVPVTHSARYEGDAVNTAIGGNLVLLRDGVPTTESHPRHPRTAIGFSQDGKKMWTVALDGRSTNSTGMTYIELANFMKQLGADDAINLDGGGSTAMVARMPGDPVATVQNVPSDGNERPVPNGIGFVSAYYPPVCVRLSLDFTRYPNLAAGATGSQVTVAQCLLGAARSRQGDPSGTLDDGTVTAIKSFQADIDLAVTGTVEKHTWTALLAYGRTPTLRRNSTGLSVARLQRALTAALSKTVDIDGDFGPLTEAAVREYQTSRSLQVDGVVGPATWSALQHGR